MSEKAMPFDYDATAADPTLYEYTATDERVFNMSNFSNGVFPQTKMIGNKTIKPIVYLGGSLAVTAGENMTIIVSPGIAMVEGVKYWLTDNKVITLVSASQQQTYDIVVELNLVTQTCTTKAQLRTDGAGLADALTRTDSVYQLCIATVAVPGGATTINAAMITDQRLNTNLAADGNPICGIVCAVSQIDTSVLYNQIMTWFETVKGVLDEDVAINLQNQINAITPLMHFESEHSKSGATHTLLCPDIDSFAGIREIRFRATAGWEGGDVLKISNGMTEYDFQTMQINGEQLPDNFFVTDVIVTLEADLSNRLCFFKGGGLPKGVFANRRFFTKAIDQTKYPTSINAEVYVTEYAFTAPKSTKYRITVVGAGGGGAGVDNPNNTFTTNRGGNGGGGGVAIKTVFLNRGQIFKITVDDEHSRFGDVVAYAGENGGRGYEDGYTGDEGDSNGKHGAGGIAIGGDTNYAGTPGSDSGGGTPSVETVISLVGVTVRDPYIIKSSSITTVETEYPHTEQGLLACGIGAWGHTGRSGYKQGSRGGVLIEWN